MKSEITVRGKRYSIKIHMKNYVEVRGNGVLRTIHNDGWNLEDSYELSGLVARCIREFWENERRVGKIMDERVASGKAAIGKRNQRCSTRESTST